MSLTLIPAPVQPKPKEKHNIISGYLFPGFLFIVAGISAVVSWYNSFLWFDSTNIRPIAVALAVMLITIGITFPRIYKRTGKKIYIRLAYIAVSLSVFTTIAGQYNNYSIKHARDIEQQAEYSNAAIDIKQLEQDERRLAESKRSLQENIETTKKAIEQYLLMGWGIGAQQNKIAEYQQQINAIDEQLNNISIQKRESGSKIEQGKTTRKGFYNLIASVFGISADIAELIIGCVFAGFIDIVCPLVAYNVKKGE